MKIYISGGITGISNYMQRFADAEQAISLYGHTAINPAMANVYLATKLSYDDVMQMCYTQIDICDAVVFLDGWKNSKGAKLERRYAVTVGKPTYEYADFIIEQRRNRDI